MLVLSRKHGEIVCIGQNVTVTVLSIDGNRVKIGVNALPEVSILRGELRDLPDASSREGLLHGRLSAPAVQPGGLLRSGSVQPSKT